MQVPLEPGLDEEDAVSVLPFDTFGGAEGIRTPYLLNAIQSLSQLSYSPNPIPNLAKNYAKGKARTARALSGIVPDSDNQTEHLLGNPSPS